MLITYISALDPYEMKKTVGWFCVDDLKPYVLNLSNSTTSTDTSGNEIQAVCGNKFHIAFNFHVAYFQIDFEIHNIG
jgi:hypothetical protein